MIPGHDDGCWFWCTSSSGFIYGGLNVGDIYSVLICLLDGK